MSRSATSFHHQGSGDARQARFFLKMPRNVPKFVAVLFAFAFAVLASFLVIQTTDQHRHDPWTSLAIKGTQPPLPLCRFLEASRPGQN